MDGLILVGVSCVGWLITGIALYTFTASLTPIPASAFGAVIGINALAFVAGQAVFIAPAGLGAKEGSITALLALYLAAPVAAVIAIAVRLWTTVVELLLVVLFARWPDRA
jgi:glycosyltransferase 2 family protein